MRRALLCVAALIVGFGLLAGWVSKAHTEDKTAKPAATAAPYVHTVIFRLKKDAPANEAEALIRDAHEMLRPIPSVRELRIGRPAEKSTPDRSRKDYDVGLLVLFDDFDGLKTYLEHPQHLKYVEKHLKYVEVEKLQVFDFINQQR
jgi:hypothetical protein